MNYHNLGQSGLQVSEFGFGAGTFGGQGPIFSAWGQASLNDAQRMIDLCIDQGVNYFDTADAYSNGASEQMLGALLQSKRQEVIISSKVGIRLNDGINQGGYSRSYLIQAVEASLKRLGTDYIDVLQLHQFDSTTPLEQLMRSLDDLVRSGKVRYIGASNFSGWQLMKAQSIAQQHGYEKLSVHQVYYSLIGRDYEWELMPAQHDQHIGAVVWSPLGWGRLTGKFDREHAIPKQSRLHETAQFAPPVRHEKLFVVLDVMQEIAMETGHSIPQIALNWLKTRPTVSSILIGARNEQQLLDNLAAKDWSLSVEQLARLDAVSAVYPPYPYYPYWNGQFIEKNPTLVTSAFITEHTAE